MRHRPMLKLALVALLLLSFHPAGHAAVRGGCAKVDITPPLGIPLIGSYGKPSDALRDELYAKALVLGDGGHTVAIVSADLLYTPLEDMTDPVRDLVQKRTGIPKQNVMVCATHTHSGPEVFTRSKIPDEGRLPASEIDHAYLAVLVRRMADSVSLAHRDMQAVSVGAAKGRLSEIVYNRRPRAEDGPVQMAFTLPPEVTETRRIESDPEGRTIVAFDFPDRERPLRFGPIDPELFVLRVDDADGRLVGSLIGFGCHPVCIYPYESTAISADYPGRATHMIEHAEGGISLFALGLAGNVVPWQRGVEPCAQIGRAVAGEALRRLQFVETRADVTLSAACKEITLPTKKPASSATDASAGDLPDPVTTQVQILRIGDIYVLGLPGEVLVEVGLEIKERAGLTNLFIVTLANDAVGYVCHAAAYDEGGYEPVSGTNLAEGAGEIMIEQALALLDEIQS